MFTELHEEEEREEGDGDEQEEKKGGLKRRETEIYAVVCSQSVFRSPNTHKDSQNWIGQRRGQEEIEVF